MPLFLGQQGPWKSERAQGGLELVPARQRLAKVMSPGLTALSSLVNNLQPLLAPTFGVPCDGEGDLMEVGRRKEAMNTCLFWEGFSIPS